MKTKLKTIGLVCALLISAYNVYSSIQAQRTLDNLVLEDVEAIANEESGGGMHGRALLYDSDFGYKCGNCSGDDCGAVC